MSDIDSDMARRVLDCPLGDGPAAESGAETIRGYLIALLAKLWDEDETFSGKRPFGNSGWRYDLYATLMTAGLMRGTFDPDGYIDDCDDGQGDQLIAAAITELGAAQ